MHRRLLVLAGLVALAACGPSSAKNDKKVLRMVPQSDLEHRDPIVITSYVTRNHGYLIYDTLFGTDANGKIQPQMVDKWETSPGGKVWTFTLRDGLAFHDGAPVTSDDVIASLERWAKRDSMGQVLATFVEKWTPLDAKAFRLTLKQPYGYVLESLGKSDSNVPFIMPKRVAQTPAEKEVEDMTGSGPFIFVNEEWRPGDLIVYSRNPKYVPRTEPPSGTAGGKVAKLDRIEWHVIKDGQTQFNALVTGEVDLLEAPAYEQIAAVKANPDLQLINFNPLGSQFFLAFNSNQPPFNNVKVRRAAMAAMNEPMFHQAQVGIPELTRTCFSVYPCNTSYYTTAGMDFLIKPNPEQAKQLLRDSGYDGTPVILLEAVDNNRINKLAIVAAQLLRSVGFNVKVDSMPVQAMTSRFSTREGWNAYLSGISCAWAMNPLANIFLSGNATRPSSLSDPALQELRLQFALARDESQRKKIAEQIQERAMEIGAYLPLGEYMALSPANKNVKGFVAAPGPLVLWNIEKE